MYREGLPAMIRGVFILTATGNILFEKVWAPIPVLDAKVCTPPQANSSNNDNDGGDNTDRKR